MQLRRACAYRTHIDRESWCVCAGPPTLLSPSLSRGTSSWINKRDSEWRHVQLCVIQWAKELNRRGGVWNKAINSCKQNVCASSRPAWLHVGVQRTKMIFYWIAGSGKPSTCLQVALDWWTKMMDCLDQKTQFRLFFSFLSAFVFLSRKVLLGIGWNGYELRRRGQRHGTDHGPRRNGWIG